MGSEMCIRDRSHTAQCCLCHSSLFWELTVQKADDNRSFCIKVWNRSHTGECRAVLHTITFCDRKSEPDNADTGRGNNKLGRSERRYSLRYYSSKRTNERRRGSYTTDKQSRRTNEGAEQKRSSSLIRSRTEQKPVSYTHLTLPTTPYV